MISRLGINSFKTFIRSPKTSLFLPKNSGFALVGKRYNSLLVDSQQETIKQSILQNNVPEMDQPISTSQSLEPLKSGDFSVYDLAHNTPVGLIQKLIEIIQVNYQLPWWMTITLLTIGLRTMLIPLQLQSEKQATRMHNIKPQMDIYTQYINRAKKAKDMIMATEYAIKLQNLFNDNGVKPKNIIILPLVQMPIMISYFIALRKLSESGLPQLTEGGILWFKNIAQYDPYYILPVLSSFAFLLNFELNLKRGASSVITPQMRLIMRAVPFVVIIFTLKFPASLVLTNNKARARLGIPIKLIHPQRQTDENKNKKKGLFSFLQK